MSGIEKIDGYKSPLIFGDDNILYLVDQRKLPQNIEYFKADTLEDVCFAIRSMVVRGAPLIGITAAFAVFLAIKDSDESGFEKDFYTALKELSATRPTAVNLFFALNKMENLYTELKKLNLPIEKLKKRIRAKAFSIWDKQRESDTKIGLNGSEFLGKKDKILTHCNTGELATGGIGTALGIIKTMHKKSLLNTVFVDETRPYLQGARLTAFELKNEGIDYRIVTDSSCGILMRKSLVDAVIVGADRIASNGDTANKIGTYPLAVLAKRHNIPFVVAAPESTIDRTIKSMDEIRVEERDALEVLKINSFDIAPSGSKALNYSFDLTDGNLITAIITERDVYEYPYKF